MNKKIFPSPPLAAGAKKPKNEFEAFDALATAVLRTPKKIIPAPKVKPKHTKP